MSLIYRDKSKGSIYQAGIREIPGILSNNNVALLILAAQEYQPKYISGTNGNFDKADILYVPLEDSIFLTDEEFKSTINKAKEAAQLASDYIKTGKNVLITCAAGLNRSGLITGFTIKCLTHGDGNNIVNLIRAKRHRNALSNPLFAYAVIAY